MWRLQGNEEDPNAGAFETGKGRNNSTAAVLRSNAYKDLRFMQTVKVTPNTDYIVSGWLKTQGVAQEDGALRGAGISVFGAWEGSEPIGGDTDWTPVQFTFNSKDRTEVEICARLGFFAACAKGTIWFDDLRMVPAGAPSGIPPAPVAPNGTNTAPPDDFTVFSNTIIFGLTREDAGALLSGGRLKSDPLAVISGLNSSVTSGKAVLVSNLGLSFRPGQTAVVNGAYSLEIMAVINTDGAIDTQLALSSGAGKPATNLRLDEPAWKRGETKFLGSFEDEQADPAKPVRFAFISIH